MIIIKYLRLIIASLCILIVLIFNMDLNKDTNHMGTKKNMDKIDYNKKINNLKEEYNNEDIVGILKIDKELEVPILQTENNDYYLNHTINKEENIYGTIFLDYRTHIDSKKLLIYGHSSTKIEISFNILENYYEKDYYESHKYISLTTNTEEKLYEIFSVYIETSDFSYMNINFIDNEDYYRHINNLKDKSIYNTDIELEYDDEILILQTCSNHKDYLNYDKKYLLIISRRIK